MLAQVGRKHREPQTPTGLARLCKRGRNGCGSERFPVGEVFLEQPLARNIVESVQREEAVAPRAEMAWLEREERVVLGHGLGHAMRLMQRLCAAVTGGSMTRIDRERTIKTGQGIGRPTGETQRQPEVAPRRSLLRHELHDLFVTGDRISDLVLKLQAIREILPSLVQIRFRGDGMTEMGLSLRILFQSQQREREPHFARGIAAVHRVGASQQLDRFRETSLLVRDEPGQVNRIKTLRRSRAGLTI